MDFERVILCSFTGGMHSTGIYSIESGVHGQIICTKLSSIQFHLPPTPNINTTRPELWNSVTPPPSCT